MKKTDTTTTAEREPENPRKCDHNEMVRDPVGKYGYWMCAKCFRPYGKPEQPQPAPGQGEQWSLHELDAQANSEQRWSAGVNGPRVYLTCDQETAKLIVRAVNNLDALAEALRAAIGRMERLLDDATGEHSPAYNQAKAALANLEGGKQ